MALRSYAIGVVFLTVRTLVAADATMPVPSNLKVEGIPAIPAALLETLGRYGESRLAAFQDWHPVKREVLITTRFGDVPQVHRVAMPGGARTQLTFYPDRVMGAHYQPKTGDAFVFSKDVGGAEFYQYYLYDMKTGEARLLTDGKSRNTGALWSRSGRWLAYASTRRNGRDTDLYVVDPSDPATTRRLLEVQGGGWAPLDWSPDDRTLLVEEYRSVTDSSLYLVNVATGAKELLTPKGEPASYSSARFSADGKGLYLTTDRESEFHRLACLDLASRKWTFLRPDLKWDVKTLAFAGNGRWLAYAVNEDGAETLHVLDTRTQREAPLPKLPYGTIGTLKWYSNGRDLGFSLSSARSPADVYSIDVEKGTLDRWTRGETGGLNAETFSEPELIRWKSFDGRMISGFLYRAAKKFGGPRPVIITIHGGPEGQSQAGFLARNNYYLNELGVTLIYPNVRGSLGYGKTYSLLDNGMKREDSVKDIGALLDWISTRPDLDAGRVMVTGGSYGGYMTLASMFHFNDRLRCGVDVVGVSNFVTLLQSTGIYRRDLRRAEYGDERDPKMRDFFMTIAPLNNAHRITKPMMIVAGKNDPRVPVTESEQMMRAIRKNGVPVWYLMAEDEGHGFSKKKNQDFQFAATVLFVKEHLLGTK
ncbi:MAG: S9 family peptidase [Acidobacteria bacterium]|nr:S9 family peptidase [Acidobacteriota bacterium]